MSPNDGCPDNDSFMQAFSEYREQTSDTTEFADLPPDVQCDIVERACRIQSVNDRRRAYFAA